MNNKDYFLETWTSCDAPNAGIAKRFQQQRELHANASDVTRRKLLSFTNTSDSANLACHNK